MRPLTDSERQLVIENQGLTYTVVYSMVLTGKLLPQLKEDAISEGMIGLMQASVAYDPQNGYQFSTLAMLSIKRKIMQLIEKEFNQTKRNVASMDAPLADPSEKTLGDILPATDDVEQKTVGSLMDYIKLISKNHPKSKSIETLIEYANGKNMTELAKERGVSKQCIQLHVSDAKKILQNLIGRTDWS